MSECEGLMAGSCSRSPRAAGLVVVLVVELVALRAAQFVPVADGHLVRLAEPDASRQHLELGAPARHAREQHVVAEVVGLLKVLHGARGAFVRRQLGLVGTRVLGARTLRGAVTTPGRYASFLP